MIRQKLFAANYIAASSCVQLNRSQGFKHCQWPSIGGRGELTPASWKGGLAAGPGCVHVGLVAMERARRSQLGADGA